MEQGRRREPKRGEQGGRREAGRRREAARGPPHPLGQLSEEVEKGMGERRGGERREEEGRGEGRGGGAGRKGEGE